MAWVGGLTAVFAATIGLVQTDIKRVLAYSTISQLGYMFVGVGVGAYAAGIFHLVTHAFFKALLFLGAGSVIHALGGEQDLRKMGGLAPRMMTTTVTFLIGAFGLAGVPPLAGFFSKDEILAAVFHEHHYVLWLLLLAGAFMTAFYTFRLVFLTFFGAPRMSKEVAHHVHESPAAMTVPLIILAVATVVGGPRFRHPVLHRDAVRALPRPGAAGRGRRARRGHRVHAPAALRGDRHRGGGARLVRLRAPAGAGRLDRRAAEPGCTSCCSSKYYVDEIYDSLFVRPIYRLSLWLARVFDPRVIDGLVNGSATAVLAWARGLRRVQTGYV